MNRLPFVNILEPQHLFKEGPSQYSIDKLSIKFKEKDVSIINFDLTRLDNTVPKNTRPVYEETSKLQSPSYLPTMSQTLNTLIKEQPFQIDKETTLNPTTIKK
ncbi:hypothetical protein CR513_20836, partial [Mucuna pruriens]